MTVQECGVVIHEESCLCDVRPAKSVMVSKDAVFDMWQGERIAEILGYLDDRHQWDNESMLHYLETLLYVHDVWVESNGHYYKTFDDIKPIVFPSGWLRLQQWKLIRDSVMAVCNQHPEIPVLDVLKKLNITLEEFIRAVTVNKSHHYMNETEFRSFNDEMVNTVKPNYAHIARVYKTGRGTRSYWKRLFQTSRDRKGQTTK